MPIANPVGPLGGHYQPFLYEEGSITGAVGGPAALPNGDVVALYVVFENGPVRLRWDGGDPSPASGGYEYDHLASEVFNRAEAAKLRWVRTGATNGTYRATYYRLT